MADLDGMALFVRIAEAGSLSAAARSLGLPKSTVSRRLTLLEASLGTPLLHRSTRALTLTDAGRTYLERVRSIVRDAELAELEIKSRSARPVGIVRLSATTIFGQMILAPILCRLLADEPGLRIDLRLADQRLDLFGDNLDIAVRMGAIEDSTLMARRLCTVSRVLCAAPAYLTGRSQPVVPSDLRDHECIVTHSALDVWHFADGTSVRVPWRLAAGTIQMAYDAARGGRGIALLPRFVAADTLRDGQLVELLSSHPLPSAQATALYPRDRVPSLTTKTVLDALANELRGKEL